MVSSIARALAVIMLCISSLPSAHAALPAIAYEDAVEALQHSGVIDQGSARIFDPLTRAEALMILLRNQPTLLDALRRIKDSLSPVPLFSDVDQSSWYAPAVEVGFAQRMVRGYPDGTFRPSQNVSVAEAVALLVRSYGFDTSSLEFQSSPDLPNDPSAWYAPAVSMLIAKRGVMPTSKLRVGDAITRGQFFDMVYRLRLSRGQATQSVVTQTSTSRPSSVAHVPVSSSFVPVAKAASLSSKNFSISIPSIGLHDLTVTHPDDTSTQKGILAPLSQGVGHLLGYPGEGGKVMIYGHSSDYPWKISEFSEIFSTINKAQLGDRISVTYQGKLHEYVVTEKKTIPAKDRSPFEPDEHGEELILYTCWPVGSITSRYVVIARPVESVAR